MLIPVRVDRHRLRRLPEGNDGRPTGCACAEEFMAGRFELPRELIHVFGRFYRDPSLLRFDRQHGTGHGVGSFLNVHENTYGFSSNVPLVPGHVLTNEPGYCK